MKKEELEEKVWYRFLKVLFWVVAVLTITITFYVAQGFANEQTQMLDKYGTYERLGQKIRDINPNAETWDTSVYPDIKTSSNMDIGEAFYEDRFLNEFFNSIWSNKQGDYEIYFEVDRYSDWEKMMIYLKYLGGAIFALFTLWQIGMYVLTGKNT
jgi:polyferredoxin